MYINRRRGEARHGHHRILKMAFNVRLITVSVIRPTITDATTVAEKTNVRAFLLNGAMGDLDSRRLCGAAVLDVFLPFSASYWRVLGPGPFAAIAVCLRYGWILSA